MTGVQVVRPVATGAMVNVVEQPETDTPERLRLMRRVAVTMFLVGGATAAMGVEITARTAASRWTQGMCAAGFVLCGLALLALPVRRRVIEAAVVVSVAVLGVLIAGSNPTGMASLFYLWPMVFAAYFCSARFTACCMAWSAASLGVALAANPHHELKVDTFVGTVSSVGLMTVLVSTMTRREARLRAQLAESARTDSLTGLLNRRAFDGELTAGLAGSQAHGRPVALVMFDLDHFKQFNDRYGHLAGDDALRAMASVLRGEVRAGDAVGRFGGEEFTVALANADLAAARAFYERVARRLSGSEDPWIAQLTASAGISVSRGVDTAGEMFERADRALYAAKAAGRARCATVA